MKLMIAAVAATFALTAAAQPTVSSIPSFGVVVNNGTFFQTNNERLYLFLLSFNRDKSIVPRGGVLIRQLAEDLERLVKSGDIHSYDIDVAGTSDNFVAVVSLVEMANADPVKFTVPIDAAPTRDDFLISRQLKLEKGFSSDYPPEYRRPLPDEEATR